MMAKDPQLRMEIIPSKSRGAKKDVFKDDIYVSNNDAQRLRRFIKENFAPIASIVK